MKSDIEDKRFELCSDYDRSFGGADAALIFEGKLLMILRDDIPTIAFPNMWCFPGGGKEGNENPLETAIREIREEVGIDLKPKDFVWGKGFPPINGKTMKYTFVSNLSKEHVDSVVLGNEGQRLEFMDFATFFDHPNVIPKFKDRFRYYLNTLEA